MFKGSVGRSDFYTEAAGVNGRHPQILIAITCWNSDFSQDTGEPTMPKMRVVTNHFLNWLQQDRRNYVFDTHTHLNVCVWRRKKRVIARAKGASSDALCGEYWDSTRTRPTHGLETKGLKWFRCGWHNQAYQAYWNRMSYQERHDTSWVVAIRGKWVWIIIGKISRRAR